MKRVLGLILSACLVLGLCACGGSKAETSEDGGLTWQEQYDLGIRYLSEGNYEEAIIAFTAAIEIDPKRVDAYIGLADVYTAQGNIESALNILTRGIDATGDAALEDYRKKLDAKRDPWGSLTTEQQEMLQALDTAVRNFDQRTVHSIMASEELEHLYMNSPLLWHQENDNDMSMSGFDVAPEDGVGYNIFTREYTANSGQVDIFEVYFLVCLNGNRYYSCDYTRCSDDSNQSMGIYHRTPNAENIADGPYEQLTWFFDVEDPNYQVVRSTVGTARNGFECGIKTQTNLSPNRNHYGCTIVIQYDENGYITNYGAEQVTEDGLVRYGCSMDPVHGCSTTLDPNQQYRCT